MNRELVQPPSPNRHSYVDISNDFVDIVSVFDFGSENQFFLLFKARSTQTVAEIAEKEVVKVEIKKETVNLNKFIKLFTIYAARCGNVTLYKIASQF